MNASKICDVPFLAPSNSTGELIPDPNLGRLCALPVHVLRGAGPSAGSGTHRLRASRVRVLRPASKAVGTWKARLLSDNKIWFGMNGPGQLACFNPITESYEDVPPHSPSTKNSHLTDVVEGTGRTAVHAGLPLRKLREFRPVVPANTGKSPSRKATISSSPPVSLTADTSAFSTASSTASIPWTPARRKSM